MNIKDLIPQREPFLFIDKIIDMTDANITVEYTFNSSLDFFKGHFPANPVVPGVILNEHCFQSGAALIASKSSEGIGNKLAVVSRITNAKFKNIVRPNEKITTTTELVETLANAAYFKSTVKMDHKKVLTIEFACTLVEEQ